MAPEPKRGTGPDKTGPQKTGPQRAGPQSTGPMDRRDNKFVQALESARAHKRRRPDLDDDYRRPLYQPAVPPGPDEPR